MRAKENDILKLEFAAELGLLEKIEKFGWNSLTARESGKIGGLVSGAKKRKKKEAENEDLR